MKYFKNFIAFLFSIIAVYELIYILYQWQFFLDDNQNNIIFGIIYGILIFLIYFILDWRLKIKNDSQPKWIVVIIRLILDFVILSIGIILIIRVILFEFNYYYVYVRWSTLDEMGEYILKVCIDSSLFIIFRLVRIFKKRDYIFRKLT